jgi:hypothetical protein
MTNFKNYTDSILSAFQLNAHAQDLVNKKYEIIGGVFDFYNQAPTDVLCVGFNPAILALKSKNITVTEISEQARSLLTSNGIKFTHVEHADLIKYQKKFDVVIALDEYFTFANSDKMQQDQIGLFCSLARDLVISTVRDYKNQEYKDREYSQPVLSRNGNAKFTYLESHDWDIKDRASWKTTVFEIDQTAGELTTYGSFDRRTMYFKQLAKFSLDNGAGNFIVHKNLMYKGLVKKNYEHVISITFDGN